MQQLLHDAGRLGTAILFVAGLTLPLALLLHRYTVRESLLWRLPRNSFAGGEILGWFLVFFLLPVLGGVLHPLIVWSSEGTELTPELAGQLGAIWSTLILLPLMILGIVVRGGVITTAGYRTLSLLRFSLTYWFPLTLLTVLVYLLSLLIQVLFGVVADEHPFTQLLPQVSGRVQILIVLAACGAAPLIEEFLFRGLLIPWATRRRIRSWILASMSSLILLLSNKELDLRSGRIGLAIVIILGMVSLEIRRPHLPVRVYGAIWSSAALFAAFHASVWPTPVPLMVLGLGLGWLMARTQTFLPGVLVHALFNACSVIHLLRGGA